MMRVAAGVAWALGAALGFAAAGVVSLAPSSTASGRPPVMPGLPAVRTPTDIPSVRHDVFVLHAVAAPLPSMRIPAIRLTGLLGGGRGAALLDGIPDAAGTVLLSPGDSVGGVRLLAIVGDEAFVLAGTDTLRLRLSEER